MAWLIGIAVATSLVGQLLVAGGRKARRGRGLSDALTVDLDSRNLYSARYGLAGRAARLIRDGEFIIPEEWKGSRRVYDSNRAQLAVYFILIEEGYGVRPPYGVVVTGDGNRERVENADEIRAWVLDIAERIRAVRRQLAHEIPVRQPAAKCRACAMRDGCRQRSA